MQRPPSTPFGNPYETGKTFFIGGHTAPTATEEAYERLAASGIEYIILYTHENLTAASEDFYKTPFELGEKYGIKILPYTNNLGADDFTTTNYNIQGKSFCEYWMQYESFGGLIVYDEPTAGTLAELTAIHDKIEACIERYKEQCPNKAWYVNLNPIYANSDTQLGDLTYTEYVEMFSDVVYKPTEGTGAIWCDIYPLYTTGELHSNWLKNLEILRAEADEQGVELQLYIQSIDWGTHRVTTEADLRFQTYVSMAYGAVGISYFTYQTPYWTSVYESSTALIDENGNATAVYTGAQEVNKEIKRLDGVYLGFDWKAVIASGSCANFTNCTNMETAYGSLQSVTSTEEAIVGCFENANGEEGYLAVNFTDPQNAQSNAVTLTFSSAVKKAYVYIDGVQTEVEVENGVLTLQLEAGEGQFVIPLTE